VLKILFTSIAAWRAVLPLITLHISGLAPACNKHLNKVVINIKTKFTGQKKTGG